MKKNILVLLLAACMAVSLGLSGCGSSTDASSGPGTADSSADSATDASDAEASETDTPAVTGMFTPAPDAEIFSWTVTLPDDADNKLTHWNLSPAIQQWMMDCGENIGFEWNNAPIAAEADFYNTLLATDTYTDVMSPTISSYTASQLYAEGVALDLTELVEENMPDYIKWVEEHPQYRPQVYKNIDGQEKIINIYGFSERPESWSGLLYRRDWILKYGKNPQTGEAFTGGWQDEEKTVWEDDIVFPSGSDYPVYISDWEWMLQIFEDALAAEGITDGCAVTMQYNGYYPGNGTLMTGFGGNFPGWQINRSGEVEYGWTDQSDAARAYVECLHHWYEEGWLDPSFDERTSDSVFFMINQQAMYAGKIGCFYGLTITQTGNLLETGESAALDGICVLAAPQPINDIYGPESVQNVEPWHYYESGSLLRGEIIITDHAKDKDIGRLLRAINYLYTEGGEALTTMGVSDVQQAEHQYQLMIDLGLPDGTYTLETDENGERLYNQNPEWISKNCGWGTSLNLFAIGYVPLNHIDEHKGELEKEAIRMATLYQGGGDATYLTDTLSTEDLEKKSQTETAVKTILDISIPDFITGRTELNDETWAAFQQQLLEQGVDEITAAIRARQ